MPFTPRQLEGLESYSYKWNNDGTYSIILKRRVETKFLGFLWPVHQLVVDKINYDGVSLGNKRYQSSDTMDADLTFLKNHIANMWQK